MQMAHFEPILKPKTHSLCLSCLSLPQPPSTISDPSPINYNDHDGTTTERYRWMNVHGARGNGSYCDVGVCTVLVCCLLLEFAGFFFLAVQCY
ncbi:hypothetical protein ES288_D05G015700v1 [Gossypium darwinii]|uniref:Uncharacterized protein n=1 Tax=Gossypium darwinii TaxID=34276 RepID=A0A5D2CAU0_GOSDA|nr:hypothetical protein ES288_D05G015700v1 [Gossypium darwinii]